MHQNHVVFLDSPETLLFLKIPCSSDIFGYKNQTGGFPVQASGYMHLSEVTVQEIPQGMGKEPSTGVYGQ